MYEKIDYTVGGIFFAISPIFTYYLGGWDALIRGLLALMFLDIVSGVLCSFVYKKTESEKMRAGIVKKIGVLVMIAVAVILENTIGFDSGLLRNAVVFSFIGVEALSILENWGKAGLPIHPKIKDVLAQLSSKSENKDI